MNKTLPPTLLSIARESTISRLVLILMALITLAACRSAPSGPEKETDIPLLPHLMGEWAWECSSGGFAGEMTCAATSGVTQTWEFRTDSMFRWMRSDTLVLTAPFHIIRHGPGITGDSINLLVLDGWPPLFALEMPTPDRLIATEQCFDCYISTWARIQTTF